MIWHVFIIFLIPTFAYGDDEYPKVKMCRGAETLNGGRYTRPYFWIKYKFQNCTHITGHLIVIGVKGGNLAFLNSIVEVYGGVIVRRNRVDVPLKNLKVIRGKNLISSKRSLDILKNYRRVNLRSLRSVVSGDVRIYKNKGECYLQTIKWRSLFEKPSEQTSTVTSADRCRENLCNSTCNGHCWGPGSELCQEIPDCGSDRCAENGRRCLSQTSCCDKNCIGGCTGDTEKDCVACRSFINVDSCVPSCPPKYDNDFTKNKDNENSDFKYTSYLFCRKKCPKHFFLQESECKSVCNKEYYLKGRQCVKCPDGKCPKDQCRLDVLRDKLPKKTKERYKDGSMHRSLIKMLPNCSTLFGNIRINAASWSPPTGFSDERVRYEDLFNLRNIRRIQGFVHVDLTYYPEANNLSFFSNLESIISYESNHGLEIFKGRNLAYLGLVNLTELVVEDLKIIGNPKLCFLERIRAVFSDVKNYKALRNAPNSLCLQQDRVCAKTCDDRKGCWGPGAEMCLACAQFEAHRSGRRKCVSRCEDERGFYTQPGNSTCAPCHPECAESCVGPRADQCKGGCKNLKDVSDCVKACPFTKFANETSGLCLPCAPACTNIYGRASCSGPLAQARPNGCNRCSRLVAVGAPLCFVKQPPRGYYPEEVSDAHLKTYPHLKDYVDLKLSILLFPCDKKCEACHGHGPDKCSLCRQPFYKLGTSTCTSKCPSEDFYPWNPGPAEAENKENMRRCMPCDDECRSCTAPSKFNCTQCKKLKVFLSPERKSFFCNTSCPLDQPYSAMDDLGESYCVTEAQHYADTRLALSVAMPIFLVVVFVVMTVVTSIYVWKRRARLRQDREKLRAKYTGRLDEDRVRLNVTTVCPNASHLRVIGVSRIKKGNAIGAGAFGTVYKGAWMPEPEDPSEIPVDVKVAIKELKNQGNKRSTEEFLSEARLMASVDNQYCIKLLGVCMTSELMLISEFMPLGNLKDYLQLKHKEIGSKRLLFWAIQIAKGMDYLASRDIIHRDLAARNVLLESEDHLRITDFGLAKLVDHGHEFQDQGQRLPIKWLACECIRSQIFSTKSDVWAFGVTLWEMFTFGEPPYRELHAVELLRHLDSGERLPQPPICTLDLYMLMIKCWLADPISRPTFEELMGELKKMAADPGRYLIIEGDNLRRGPLRSVSTLTASSVEGVQACAKVAVAVVNFDLAPGKCFDTSGDSGELLEGHYVEDPTSFCAGPDPPFLGSLRRPPAITESCDEIDEVFNQENDYERPLALRQAMRDSEYVAPRNGTDASSSPGAYMNIPDTTPLLVSNPTYSTTDPSSHRHLEEAIEDYPLTPFAQPSQYMNLRF